MTTNDHDAAGRPTGTGTGLRRMLGTAVLPGLVVSVACVVLAAVLVGTAGLVGAVVGAVLTAAFFTLSVLVLSRTQRLDSVLAIGVVMSLYLAKVIVLGGLFLLLTRGGPGEGVLDRTSLGLTLLVTTLAWTVAELVAATRNRQPVYDLGEER